MSSILPPGINDLISIFVYLPLSWPPHLRQPCHTPSNPPQLVQRSNIPCAHAHLFSTMKQTLLTPTTGFSLVYDLGSPVVSTPAGRGSTSSSEGGPVDVVAHFFLFESILHVRVYWPL